MEGKMKDEYDRTEEIINNITRPGISNEEVIDIYATWAEHYDQDNSKIDYNPPKHGARELSALLGHNKFARILDCGAGTGLCGIELAKLGFSNVDALDASQPMLDQAKKKGVYKNYICDYMGPNTLDIHDDTYDGLVTVGTFTGGHVKCDCFEELIRVTKPGGVIVGVMREINLLQVEEYRDRLVPTMERLVEAKKWKWVVRKQVPQYHNQHPGFAFGFEVLLNGNK